MMRDLVSSVMKLSIRGVVEWKDREITATKKAISPVSYDHSTMKATGDGSVVRTSEEYLDAAGLSPRKGDDEYSMPPEETLL